MMRKFVTTIITELDSPTIDEDELNDLIMDALAVAGQIYDEETGKAQEPLIEYSGVTTEVDSE